MDTESAFPTDDKPDTYMAAAGVKNAEVLCPTRYYLDSQQVSDFINRVEASGNADCVESSRDRRRISLIRWLGDSKADSTDILDWNEPHHIGKIRRMDKWGREEFPGILLRALPGEDDLLHHWASTVLMQRIGETLLWLAESHDHCIRLTPGMWACLLGPLSTLKNKSIFAEPVRMLLERFDEEGLPWQEQSFSLKSQLAQLAYNHQMDNNLGKRWLNIAEQKKDTTLDCSVFDAIRGLLSMPEEIDQDTLKRGLKAFCQALEAGLQEDEERTNTGKELLGMIDQDYSRYSRRARAMLSNLSDSYP